MHRHERAEDLLAGDLRGVVGAHDGRLDVAAVRQGRIGGRLAAEQHLAALGLRDLDVRQHAIAVQHRGERAHLGRRVLRVADPDAAGEGEEPLEELVDDVLVDDEPARGDARLALVVEDAEGRASDGGRQHRILEHDVRALAAELEVHLLERRSRAGGNGPADIRAAGERHLGDAGVVDDALARSRAVARQDVHNARGEADFGHELGDPQGAERSDLRRLEHHGVAGCERRPHLPAAEHDREVPRHDLADDAERLGSDVVEEPGLDRHDAALELVGHAAEVPEGRRGAHDVEVAGVADRVPGVAGLDEREVVGIGLDRVGELEQEPAAVGRGHPRPAVRGVTGRVDRAVDICRLGLGHLCEQ